MTILNTWAKDNNTDLTVTSMFRLPAYNDIVGGHKRSSHLEGSALDLNLSTGRKLKTAFDNNDPKDRGAIQEIELHGDHYHIVLRSTQIKGE